MPRRTRTEPICKTCDLPQAALDGVNARMAAGQRNADISRWLRVSNFTPPTATMLNRHRNNDHFMGDRTVNESNDTSLAANHRDGLNLMQRVQLNVTHTLLPRLAMAPKKLNTLEEMQELYVFTKNQLAQEFEISQNTPEVYEHPVTGDQVMVRPTSPNMMKLVRELRMQLKEIDDLAQNVIKSDDIMPELVTKLMGVIQAEDHRLEEVQSYMYQAADMIDAEIDEDDEEDK